MDGAPDPGENHPAPFPGDPFWQRLESLMSAVGLGSPRMIFRLRHARARWEARRERSENIERSVSYTHKTCPACGRLVERGAARCPYCDANVRWAPGPGIVRSLGLSVPHGSVAMTLIVLNVICFAIATLASARGSGTEVLQTLFRPDGAVLYNMGSLEARSVVAFGQIWRLWTYQFLHFGAFHILFNVYALFSLGPATEDVYGPSKTAVLYWTTGVGAGVVSLAIKLAVFFGSGGRIAPATVGASGAIFGLIGLLIGHAIRRGGAEGAYLRSFLMRWAVYGLVMGFLLGADNAAHIGGLVTGFLLGLVVREGEPAGGRAAGFWRLAALSVVALTVYGFIAAGLAPHA